MKTTFIYALIDPRDGGVRYIGKADSLSARMAAHWTRAGGLSKSYKNCWLRGLRKTNLRPAMVILEEVNQEQWQSREREWIKAGRELGMPLTNLADGGEGTSLPGAKNPFFGRVHSLETRRKIREARARQIFSEESQQKRAASLSGEKNYQFGKPRSSETKERIRRKLLGRKITPEALANRPRKWSDARRASFEGRKQSNV